MIILLISENKTVPALVCNYHAKIKIQSVNSLIDLLYLSQICKKYEIYRANNCYCSRNVLRI